MHIMKQQCHAAQRAPLMRRTLAVALLLASVASSTALAAVAPASDVLGASYIDTNDSQLQPSNLDMCTIGSSGATTHIDYEYLVKCTRLQQSRGLAELLLVLMLAALLYLLSSTADSFFCPVLQVRSGAAHCCE